jgi:hypothetical protein
MKDIPGLHSSFRLVRSSLLVSVVADVEPPFVTDRFRFLRLDDAVDNDGEDTEEVLAVVRPDDSASILSYYNMSTESYKLPRLN